MPNNVFLWLWQVYCKTVANFLKYFHLTSKRLHMCPYCHGETHNICHRRGHKNATCPRTMPPGFCTLCTLTYALPLEMIYKTHKGDEIHASSQDPRWFTPSCWFDSVSYMRSGCAPRRCRCSMADMFTWGITNINTAQRCTWYSSSRLVKFFSLLGLSRFPCSSSPASGSPRASIRTCAALPYT